MGRSQLPLPRSRPPNPPEPQPSVIRLPLAFQAVALALPGFVRLGHFRLPIFGLIAATGLIMAMFLSRYTAPLAGLEPERVWDAGVVAVAAAFLSSRALLVLMNFRLFLRNPVLVLAQPSLTAGGVLLAALILGWWLRRSGLPWRAVLDAWAPPAALLSAMLQLSDVLQGTTDGTPTTLPWGIPLPGGPDALRVHPVHLYATVGALLLCIALLRSLRRGASSVRGYSRAVAGSNRLAASAAEGSLEGLRSSGAVAAQGLLAGGALAFLLNFLRQPHDLTGNAWLDPEQYAALLAIVFGAMLIVTSPEPLTGPTLSAPLQPTGEPR